MAEESGNRGSFRAETVIDRSAETVWAWVGAPDRIQDWFPGIVSSSVEGSKRTIVMASGLSMPEVILTLDPLIMRFQYRISSPIVKEHLGTIDVHELTESSSMVVYSTDANPKAFALMIGGAAGNALDNLKIVLEADNGVKERGDDS